MYSITGTNITLTRGDSFYCQITMKEGEQTYTPGEGDVVRFALKKSYSDMATLIKKELDNSTLLLYIAPDDTKEMAYGEYVYDIELTKSNGDVDTFIKGRFRLTEEVE